MYNCALCVCAALLFHQSIPSCHRRIRRILLLLLSCYCAQIRRDFVGEGSDDSHLDTTAANGAATCSNQGLPLPLYCRGCRAFADKRALGSKKKRAKYERCLQYWRAKFCGHTRMNLSRNHRVAVRFLAVKYGLLPAPAGQPQPGEGGEAAAAERDDNERERATFERGNKRHQQQRRSKITTQAATQTCPRPTTLLRFLER